MNSKLSGMCEGMLLTIKSPDAMPGNQLTSRSPQTPYVALHGATLNFNLLKFKKAVIETQSLRHMQTTQLWALSLTLHGKQYVYILSVLYSLSRRLAV